MNLTTARTWVRRFTRNGIDTTAYPTIGIDIGILSVCSRFARVTGYLKTRSTVTLSAGDSSKTLAITNFRPDRLLRAYFDESGVHQPVEKTSVDAILGQRAANEAATGTPQLLAFETSAIIQLFPKLDAERTLILLWSQPFTSFTVGTNDPDNVTLGLPDDLLAEILTYGAPALIQHADPEKAYATASWQKYLELEQSCMGQGALGITSSRRAMAEA